MGRRLTEAIFSARLKPRLLAIPNSWWFKAPTRTQRGIPDWLGCVAGHFVAIELKTAHAKKDRTRETLQRYNCDMIKNCGGLAFFRATPDNIDSIIAILVSLKKEEKTWQKLMLEKLPSI